MKKNGVARFVERLLEDLISESNPHHLQVGIHDLFVRINSQTGEVSLFGDDDEPLGSTTIFAWVDNPDIEDRDRVAELRLAITTLDERGFWDNPLFERPFAIELVNEAFDTLEHLLLRDDDLIEVTTPLLEGLHEDLDKFLDGLLSDLK